MSDSIFIGSRAASLDIGDIPANVTRVNINVDSNTYYTAGDDTGRTLEATCNWATQAMANAVLDMVQGVEYQPFTASDALLNPAAEIGDGVVVGGIYSVIGTADMQFNRLFTAEISAPDLDEVDDEYPYKSLEERQYDRELARTRSLISKSSEEILLQVEGIAEDLEGQMSSISVKLDSITLDVTNGSTSSTISLKAGDVTISSEQIQMSGLVTYSGLSGGTTTIDGACIKTGTIDADRLNLTGSITFSDLSSGVQSDINDAQSTANSAYSLANTANNTANNAEDKVEAWSYRGTTYIDGSKIQTGTVEASILRGGTVELLSSNGRSIGDITITSTETGIGLEFATNRGGIRMTSAGNWWVDSATGSFGTTGNRFSFDVPPTPNSDGLTSCGRSNNRWSEIYAQSGTIVTSDLNYKTDIEYGLSDYDELFDQLRPATYRFIDGQSGRRHMGMVSQDIEELLVSLGISSNDFAAFVKSPVNDEETGEVGYRYSLRYEEFIPLLIYEVQQIKSALKERGVIA